MNLSESIENAITVLKRKKIDNFEIFASSSDTIRAESKKGDVDFLNRSSESGISIRVLIDGAMGFSYGKEADESVIEAAVTASQYQFKDSHNKFIFSNNKYPEINVFDKDITLLNPEDCIDKARLLEQSARDADSKVDNIRKASFSRSSAEFKMINSQGVNSSFTVTSISASIMVTVKQGTDIQSGYDFDFSHFLSDLDVARVGKDAVIQALQMLGARKLKTTKIPVVFDRTCTADMIEFISQSFLGESVIKGKSALKERLGKVCFSKCINLSDNPLAEKASDACPFDGEGVYSRKNILINKGLLNSFLYDSYWASVAGIESTGNSIRGNYRTLPILGTRHLCLEHSETSLQRQLEVLPLALKVTDIMGMHTANPITGELSVGINGILMENGNPAYPVREAALSGNIYDMFARVLAVGDDPRSFGHVTCPSILVDSVDVSSK